jgi:hypothetical protein
MSYVFKSMQCEKLHRPARALLTQKDKDQKTPILCLRPDANGPNQTQFGAEMRQAAEMPLELADPR